MRESSRSKIMHVISKRRFRQFWEKHDNSGARDVLLVFYKKLVKGAWQNLDELRQTFPHADLAGACVIFNVGGSKYRVVTKVFFREQTILIRYVLTHKEYDEKPYRKDCRS